MRSFLSLAMFGLTLPVAADVMPHCGGPKVDIQSPGQECGAHGPHWRGECRAPAICVVLDAPHGGHRCSALCATDADCTKLGAGFTCSAQGVPSADRSQARQSVCAMAQ